MVEKHIKNDTTIKKNETETIQLNNSISKTTASSAKAGKRSAKSLQEQKLKIDKELKKQEKNNTAKDKLKIAKKNSRPILERKGKKYQTVYKLINKDKIYDLKEAIELVKKTSFTKFDATVELHIQLNVDPKHADQNVRDTVVLPFGTGKKNIVAVFTDDEESIKNIEVDISGNDNLITNFEKGKLNFDVLITTPSLMPKLSKYAKILGPRGLMPNLKSGTVTTNIAQAVAEAKTGKIEYRVDSYGIIHTISGKLSFKSDAILKNIQTIYNSIKNNKPQSVKSNYFKTVYITSTMGPSIKIDIASI